MQNSLFGQLFSASDLVNFAACSHLTQLDLQNLVQPMPKVKDSEESALFQNKGFEHEARYLAYLRQQYGSVVDIQQDGLKDEAAFTKTRQVLHSGVPVVFQATFLSAPWVGHADFLVRVETPSKLGSYSYEVVDTKLAKTSRAKFLLQLCLYSDLLAQVQGFMPQHMHVVLGDSRKESFLVANYLRYFRHMQMRFLQATLPANAISQPEQCEHCPMCHWRERCHEQWEQGDHLNRVAAITKPQILRLKDSGISTMHALAKLPADQKVARIQDESVQRLAQQARLQVQSQASGVPVYELLAALPAKGFARLPLPNPGDLFFDMEGNPLEDGGLEYLFGLYYFDAGRAVFKAFWAHDLAQEKQAFEAFMDFVTARLARHPRAHIYHYAPYENTALKRLMSSHGTRETAVDNLLRQHKLVDLYAVVRESVRVGEPNYSIKSMEHFYSGLRQGDVKNAGASIVYYEKWKATQDPALLKAIEDYNQDDVISTFELRQWLLSIRPAAATSSDGHAEENPLAEPSTAQAAAEARMAVYRRKLTSALPADRLAWSKDDRVNELLFQLLGFHRRTEKPVWWALFARQEASSDEWLGDIEVIAELEQHHTPIKAGNKWGCCYTFPEQEYKIKSGDTCVMVHNLKEVKDLVVDEDQRLVRFTTSAANVLPASGLAIGKGGPVLSTVIQAAFQRFVDAHLAGTQQFQAGLDLVHRSLPRITGHLAGTPLLRTGEELLAGTQRTVAALNRSCLFIQGPPGSGKTYTASHLIVELMRQGKKVAVTSNSHKAINNLLSAVERDSQSAGFTFKGLKKFTNPDQRLGGQLIKDTAKNEDVYSGIGHIQLVAGTAWLFASPGLELAFDYLFVDEAGQVSLANLLALSTCAKNLVLLGDQMQLGQPTQGVHPGESGLSTLEYLLQGASTIAPEAGIFLKDTWRMHPDVCRFISDAVYDGRLKAEAKTANQRLLLSTHGCYVTDITNGSTFALRPTGLQFMEVQHTGCAQRSDVEAQVVRTLFTSLLQQQYTDREGVSHPVTLSNILVVAPYNQQVNLLKRVLPEGARVGTVDKFQGQEAEVVLVSMTTSSGEFMPRDIEFLYSKNRLNVAISRARALAIVIANPMLLEISCKTPEQMALVNTLCWIREYAEQTGRQT